MNNIQSLRPSSDPQVNDPGPAVLSERAIQSLSVVDPQLYQLLADDLHTQAQSVDMVASTSLAPPSVLACVGSALSNINAEGYPGQRFHAGCRVADDIERLAVQRAMDAFGAAYANVQPHSGSAANLSVYFGLLDPGDTILGLDSDCGGYRTYGAPGSFTGKYLQAVSYGLDGTGHIDYPRLRLLAHRFHPKLIECGASAYPRTPDFARLRSIADEVGAYLLVDISHVAGLVVAGAHPSPINLAHVTTTSTSEQLCGPRGGLILAGRDADIPGPDGHSSLRRVLHSSVSPYVQGGGAHTGSIAAKARALQHVMTPEFRQLARRIVANARMIAAQLLDRGYHVLTYGTDNHMVLVDVMSEGMSGRVAEQALESCGILVSKTRIPFDVKPPQVCSGMCLGTNIVSRRGMAPKDMHYCTKLLDTTLRAVIPRSDTEYELSDVVRLRLRNAAAELCRHFPLPEYPDADLLRPEKSAAAS